MPWTSRVGAVTRSNVGCGLFLRSWAMSSRLGAPVSDASRNSAQIVGSKRPHVGGGTFCTLDEGVGGRFCTLDEGVALAPRKKFDAQTCLKGPGVSIGLRPAGVGPVAVVADCGKNASARSFHVIAATTASTRGSAPASIRPSAPP